MIGSLERMRVRAPGGQEREAATITATRNPRTQPSHGQRNSGMSGARGAADVAPPPIPTRVTLISASGAPRASVPGPRCRGCGRSSRRRGSRRRPGRRAARPGRPRPRPRRPRRRDASTASMPSSMICSASATSASTISSSGTTRTTWPFTNRWPLPRPGGDAEVGLPRLAGPVDDAAHHRDLQRDVAVLERGHRVARDLDHVDLGAPAARARDEVEALALAQAERLEQRAPGARLLDRVGGERVADRVADALGEQRADAGGRLHEPGRRRAGLGDAEVQRVVDRLGEQPVRVDHRAGRCSPSPRSSRRRSRPRAKYASSRCAEATSASGVMPPNCSYDVRVEAAARSRRCGSAGRGPSPPARRA